MKVTLNCYRKVVQDDQGQTVGVAEQVIGEANGSQKLIAAGTAAALPDETRFVRIASDTWIHVKVDGTGVTDSDPQVFANTVEYFGVREGATPSIMLG